MNKVDKFIKFISEDKGKNTIRAYKTDIKQFLDYFKNKDIHTYTKQDIENYKEYLLKRQKLKIISINRKLIAIHEFFEFYQIAIKIKLIKTQMQNFLNNILTSSDIEKIIKEAKKANDIRAITLFYTLRYTGMRISEALQLKITDINKDAVVIVGKGEKSRKVFIPKKLHTIWHMYIPYRVKKTNYLFTGQRGKIVSSTGYKMVQKYGKMADIKKEKCHPHNFRHFFCLALAKKNVQLQDISALAGHSDINTSKLYLRKSQEELLDIINDI